MKMFISKEVEELSNNYLANPFGNKKDKRIENWIFTPELWMFTIENVFTFENWIFTSENRISKIIHPQ